MEKKIGDKFRVIGKSSGHVFDIGEEITLFKIISWTTGDYDNGVIKQLLYNEDVEPIKEIKSESIEEILTTNESFWKQQFDLAHNQFQNANNKRMNKNKELETLKDTFRRTLELNEEQDRQIRDLKKNVEQLKKQIR